MAFLNPLNTLIPKIPFRFLPIFGSGSPPRPGVSLGRILGILSIEPLWGGGVYVYGPFTWLRHAHDSGARCPLPAKAILCGVTLRDGHLPWRNFVTILLLHAAGLVLHRLRDVCGTLTDVWKLPVLCPCMKNPGDSCKEKCMTREL